MPLIFFVLLLAIYSNLLEEWYSIFTYTDEILAIILFFIGLVKLMGKEKKVFSKIELIAFYLMFLTSMIAVISTIQSNYRNTIFLEIYTLFGNIKFVMIYFGLRVIFNKINERKIKSLGKLVLKFTIFFSVYNIILFISDLFFDYMIGYSDRFGLKNVAYGFGHPSEFALAVLLVTALNLYFSIRLNRKINYIYLLINFLLIFTGGRVTSIGFYMLFIIIILFFRYFRRYVFNGLVISGLVAFFFVKDKFFETFFGTGLPRGILMNTAIEIAKDYFPLGSGLGTFGSNAARITYSEMYFYYGFDNIYGLAPWYDNFLTDSYWAMIIAEIGFIGAVLILISLSLLLVNSYITNKSIIGIVISIPMLYMFISTPVDTAIVSNSALPLMLVASLFITIENKYRTLP